MNYNLEQLKQLKSLTLTEEEKGHIRSHAAYLIMNTPQSSRGVRSLFQRGMYHGLRIALSSFVFFVFIGGSVSAVADKALPGDPLYSVKIAFNEKIKGMFQTTPEEKVAYGAKRVENRVNEIKTLAASKTLTKAKQETVQKALDSHIEELSTDLNTLSDVAPTAALTATTTLEESLKASKLLIENNTTLEELSKEGALMAVDGTIQKVSDQEVKIISKEIDAITIDVTTATTTLSTSTLPANTPVGP
ncbi:MAG: hypothetical protein KBB91_02150 [Candidatus Pacebacteria bacterium]|nr:hypothetical protein [Candidatus Paceibacterota bacterium]MBP9701250.1 hypothetical protein [Candidatus Paceibacterota bacterium]